MSDRMNEQVARVLAFEDLMVLQERPMSNRKLGPGNVEGPDGTPGWRKDS